MIHKKKNGHKPDCTCPICMNMKHSKHIEKSAKKNGHKPDCTCPICMNMKHSKRGGSGMEEDDESSSDEEDNKMDVEEKEEDNKMDVDEEEEEDSDKMDEEDDDDLYMGGKRHKKGNGHKPTCQCPICKNMRKSMKGGKKTHKKSKGKKHTKKHTMRKHKKKHGGKTKRRYKRGGSYTANTPTMNIASHAAPITGIKTAQPHNLVGGKTKKRKIVKRKHSKSRRH